MQHLLSIPDTSAFPNGLKQKIIDYVNKLNTEITRYNSSQENYFTNEKQLLLILIEFIQQFLNQQNHMSLSKTIEDINYIVTHLEGIIYRLRDRFGNAINLPIQDLTVLTETGRNILRDLNPQKRIEITPEMIENENKQQREQQDLLINQNVKFEWFLEQIRIYAAKRYPAKRIFISYAWPMGNNHHEAWVTTYLTNMARHLISAGFQVYMDQLQSGAGTPLNEFMATNIELADHVLVICNRTMDFKFNKNGFTGACYEYILMIKQWKEERKNRFIIPVCFTEKNHIPGLIAQFGEVSFYNEGYFNGLMNIFIKTYGFGRDFFDWCKLQNLQGYESKLIACMTAMKLSSSNSAAPSPALPAPTIKQLSGQLMLKPPATLPVVAIPDDAQTSVQLQRYADISAKIVNNSITVLTRDDECFCCLNKIQFATLMCTNTSIQSIEFINPYPLYDDGATAIADMLCKNRHLRSLTLRQKWIKLEGCQAIAAALNVNPILEILDIGWNSFGDDGVIALANALAHNTTLKELRLTHVLMTDIGASALRNMLEKNHTLLKLDIKDNRDLHSRETINPQTIIAVNTLLARNQGINQGIAPRP